MNRNQAFDLLIAANPITDVHEYAETGAAQRPAPSAFLTDIDQERDDMTQLMEPKTATPSPKRPWWQPALAAAAVIVVAVGAAVLANSVIQQDAADLTETDITESVDAFVEAWNEGDSAAVADWIDGVTYCVPGPTCREGAELTDWMATIMAAEPVLERTRDVVTLDDGRFQVRVSFGDGTSVGRPEVWTITTEGRDITRIEEYWDLLSSFGSERPESVTGGTLFDVMTAQTISKDLSVCTWRTMVAGTTEAELLAAGAASFEDGVVAASLTCGLDVEAIPGLRLALSRSTLGEAG